MPLAVPLLGLLGLAVLAGLPTVQPWLLLAGTWAAVATTLGGMARYRPAERTAWSLVAVMLAFWGSSGVVDHLGGSGAAVGALVLAGQVCAISVVIRLFWIRRGNRRAAREGERSTFFPGAAEEFAGSPEQLRRSIRRDGDLLLLVGVSAVVVAQVVATLRALPTGVSAATAVIPVVDVVLAGLMARFLVSRDRMPRSTLVGVLAAVVTIVDDLVVIVGTGHRGPLQDLPGQIAAVLAVGLFAWAPLEPSMARAFSACSLERRRSESARLLGLMPLAAVPVLLYLIGDQDGGRLPALVYILTGVLVALIALIRGATAVLDNERLAERDWYTGLLNRRGLVVAYNELTPTTDRPWQLALLDLDDFKQINDTFGHYAGDTVLVEIARRLRATVTPEAVLGRAGGDEFVLILPAGHDPAETVARQVFSRPFTVQGNDLPVRVSIGVTDITSVRNVGEVFTEVDIALYAAKAAGRNTTVRYDPKHREQVLGRGQLLTDLRRTLDGDTSAGVFEVHYQPLVELGTGTLTGCEALIRWRHAERGLIRPDDFFGLAETCGLAGELDRWVLHEALSQVAAWEAEGIGSIYVSVNLGRTSMLDPHLAEVTLEYLAATGVRPTQLHLEITEHDELPPEAGALTLALLTEAGVRVSLDDFGIGYTSLDYLHRYPVRQLKLDRSITMNLQTDASSPLLEGIVALARSLKVDVVAEGIETEPQRARLAGLGIAYGQGYHLCRPQPAASMTHLLREAGPSRLMPDTLIHLPA